MTRSDARSNVNKTTRDAAAWKAVKPDLEPLSKAAAKRLPVP